VLLDHSFRGGAGFGNVDQVAFFLRILFESEELARQ
jgi:hypothetical protein